MLFMPFFVISLAAVTTSCRQKTETNSLENNKKEQLVRPSDEQIENANIQLKEQEKREIEAFVKRSNRKFEESATGLYYDIYHRNPEGAMVEKGNAVKISYKLSLLNGAIANSSEESADKEWVVGRSQNEKGLTDLVLKMRRGEKAYAVIPSHLAFGLSGDGEHIPERATLIYDIEIKNVYIRETIR